ncbi:hypothetical protein [Nonomuraea sp. NPDC048826]|uniref:hypothetical protein n=1 Tax=Nonomuraea sp. NPDC048826 TaxID=3364347 RepID=UPI00371A8B12
MTLQERSFSILEPRRNIDYGRDDLPSARDGQIRDLLFEVVDGKTFDQAAAFVPRAGDRVLTAFAERAASIAVRHQDARELRAGLLAVAIAQKITDDPRDSLPGLALLYRAAVMIGHDPDAEFRAANEVTDGRAGGLLAFLRWPPEDRSVEAMGFEEGNDQQGFRFLSNW